MRISSVLGLGLVTAVTALASCPGALACGCIPPAENLTMYDLVKRSVDRADLVFIGVPTALHGDGKSEDTDDLVIFAVSKVFKGEQAAQVRVHSGVGTTGMSSCGYSFEVGKTYLVFASNYENGALVMACSFTALIENSEIALRFLRKEPKPEDLLTPKEILRNEKSKILGAVRRSDGVTLDDPKVYIWHDSDSSYEKEASFTRPARDGSFESYFLPPGTYRVTAVDSSYGPTRWVGCYTSQSGDTIPAKIDVMAGHDYRWTDIVLHEQRVYSIRGIVRSNDGTPLSFEHVEIKATMTPNEMFPFLDFVQPHADGTFNVLRAPVGTVRLKTYVSEYDDPNWETSVIDVEVNADVEGVEIVLNRKSGATSGTLDREISAPD